MGEFKQISREALRTEGFPKPPVDLTEEVMLSLSEKQRQILFDLCDLGKDEEKLIDFINAHRPTASGILGFPGGSITLCETDDDWKMITLKQRSELKEVQKKAAALLDKALDLGMGSLGIIQRQCPNYKVKP